MKKIKVKNFQDTIKWYEDNAEYYAEKIKSMACIAHINRFAKHLPAKAKVLDAGCGSGRDAKIFTQKGFDVVGIDFVQNLIAIAKKNCPKAKFLQGDFRRLPFENESFNGVWAYAALVHLETIKDAHRALAEFYRVLKPKGVLCVFVKAQTGKVKTAVVSDAFSCHDRFFRYYTRGEVGSMLQKANFEIIELKHIRELDYNPKGRPEVEWIWALARRNS